MSGGLDGQPGTSDHLRRLAGLAALDCSSYGVIVVDDYARLMFTNDTARRFLAGGGSSLVHGDVLRPPLDTDDVALKAAIAGAARPEASWQSGASALRIRVDTLVMPVLVLPSGLAGDPLLRRRGYAFVLFGGPTHIAHRELLASMYQLTPRESELACELLEGRSLTEVARRLQVTLHTARSHLKRVLEKTSTSRQAELVRVLIRSTPGSR